MQCSNCNEHPASAICKECTDFGPYLCTECDSILHRKKNHKRDPLHACDNCDASATSSCVECNTYFCDTCFPVLHQKPAKKGHQRVPIQGAVQSVTSVIVACSNCDQPAIVHCNECQSNFCQTCNTALHKKESKMLHVRTSVNGSSSVVNATVNNANPPILPKEDTSAPGLNKVSMSVSNVHQARDISHQTRPLPPPTYAPQRPIPVPTPPQNPVNSYQNPPPYNFQPANSPILVPVTTPYVQAPVEPYVISYPVLPPQNYGGVESLRFPPVPTTEPGQNAPPFVLQDQIQVVKKPIEYKRLHLLVFGETGAGKSTLINTLYLWSLDKALRDCKELAIPVDNEFSRFPIAEKFIKKVSESFHKGGAKSSQSQTNIANFYDFKLKKNEEEGYHIIAMDTPGFADTRGITQDSINLREILNAITNSGLPDINGIICMANGTQARSAALLTVIKNLTAIFPKGFETNLKILYSNVQPNADPTNIFHLELADCIKRTLAEPKKYDNQLFRKDFTKLPRKPAQKASRNVFYYEDAENIFSMVKEALCEIFDELLAVPPATPTKFTVMKESNDKIDLAIAEAISYIKSLHAVGNHLASEKKSLEETSRKIRASEDAIAKQQMEMKQEKERFRIESEKVKNAKDKWNDKIKFKETELQSLRSKRANVVPSIVYKTEFSGVDWKLVDTSAHNTLCGHLGNCHSNCHTGCGLEVIIPVGDQKFQSCAAFGSNDMCKVCGHSYTYHYHKQQLWESTDKYQQVNDTDAMEAEKRRIEDDLDQQISNIEDEIRRMKKSRDENIEPKENTQLLQEYQQLIDQEQQGKDQNQKILMNIQVKLDTLTKEEKENQARIEQCQDLVKQHFTKLKDTSYIGSADVIIEPRIKQLSTVKAGPAEMEINNRVIVWLQLLKKQI